MTYNIIILLLQFNSFSNIKTAFMLLMLILMKALGLYQALTVHIWVLKISVKFMHIGSDFL